MALISISSVSMISGSRIENLAWHISAVFRRDQAMRLRTEDKSWRKIAARVVPYGKTGLLRGRKYS
jgi:hypothetical protein